MILSFFNLKYKLIDDLIITIKYIYKSIIVKYHNFKMDLLFFLLYLIITKYKMSLLCNFFNKNNH